MTKKEYQEAAFAQMRKAKFYEDKYVSLSEKERNEISIGGRTRGMYLVQLHEQALNMEAYYTKCANRA